MNPPHTNSTKGELLIVDDVPDNLRLLSAMLRQRGYCVFSATSGADALSSVRAKLPDLILLDIKMPNMNGYEVCERLKSNAQTRDIPIIFLSALDDTVNKVKAFRVGGADYISKPFQLAEVIVRVENQLTLRRMQRELQQANAHALKALEQEKELNQLKSEFISMVSHDFRIPLTSIQGFVGLLQEREADLSWATRHHYFNKVNAAVEHLLRLLDEVLLLGSLEAGKIPCQPVPLELEPFCRDLLESIQLSANNTHQIELLYAEKCGVVELDPHLLRQILINLLSNAIKYSPNCDRIQLELECEQDTVTFRVRDCGIGIPQENQARVFETFYRGGNVGQIKGTGLGLAVVKQCVEAHWGTIRLESEVGKGTTATVTLRASGAKQ